MAPKPSPIRTNSPKVKGVLHSTKGPAVNVNGGRMFKAFMELGGRAKGRAVEASEEDESSVLTETENGVYGASI